MFNSNRFFNGANNSVLLLAQMNITSVDLKNLVEILILFNAFSLYV